MMRYKGRLSSKNVEKTYPNIVEMEVPPFGFRRRMYDLEAWHFERSLRSRTGQGVFRDGVWFVHWCFLAREDAEAFRSRFGGELSAPVSNPERGRRGQR